MLESLRSHLGFSAPVSEHQERSASKGVAASHNPQLAEGEDLLAHADEWQFGVEIEISDRDTYAVAATVAAALDAPAPDVSAWHFNMKDKHSDTWAVHGEHCGSEVVSPPLRGKEGLQRVINVAAALKAGGASVEGQTGMHIHIDAANLLCNSHNKKQFDLAKLKNLFATFFNNQDALYKALQVKDERLEYCNPLPRDLVEKIVASKAKSINDLHAQITGWGRYFGLNPKSIDKHGTVEFRLANSSCEPAKIGAAYGLFIGMAEAARTAAELPTLREGGSHLPEALVASARAAEATAAEMGEEAESQANAAVSKAKENVRQARQAAWRAITIPAAARRAEADARIANAEREAREAAAARRAEAARRSPPGFHFDNATRETLLALARGEQADVSPERVHELAHTTLVHIADFASNGMYNARAGEALMAVASGRNERLALAARDAIIHTFIPGLGRAVASLGTGLTYQRLYAMLGDQNQDFRRAAEQTMVRKVLPAFANRTVEMGTGVTFNELVRLAREQQQGGVGAEALRLIERRVMPAFVSRALQSGARGMTRTALETLARAPSQDAVGVCARIAVARIRAGDERGPGAASTSSGVAVA